MAAMNESDIARLVYKAKLAEQAERFEEMCKFMHTVIENKRSLDTDEQKLFAIAYKNRIGRVRTAWRFADTARAKYAGRNQQKESFASQYAQELAEEVLQICREVEDNLGLLARSATDPVSRASYAKMDADYRRYRCEIEPKETSNTSAAYKNAANLAQELPPAHPTRMGIALNYSVFKYEIENSLEEACRIAEQALEGARADGGMERSRDAFLIEHLLKDNMDLWRSEAPKPKEELAF